MRERVGIVGVGAMGKALLKGLLTVVEKERLLVADKAPEKLEELKADYQVEVQDVSSLVQAAQVIFLAVKPQDLIALLKDIVLNITAPKTIVSVAAGISIAKIENELPDNVGVIRVMPNTPCLINEGVMAVSAGSFVSADRLQLIVSWLQNLGVVRVVPEELLDAVTGLSGSGPAYVYLLIEALADGGVLAGLPRELALEFAVQTVLGAAKMVQETDQHPAILREMVTSPGGTTAAGLLQLEQGAFRSLLQKAVAAAAKRAKELDG